MNPGDCTSPKQGAEKKNAQCILMLTCQRTSPCVTPVFELKNSHVCTQRQVLNLFGYPVVLSHLDPQAERAASKVQVGRRATRCAYLTAPWPLLPRQRRKLGSLLEDEAGEAP